MGEVALPRRRLVSFAGLALLVASVLACLVAPSTAHAIRSEEAYYIHSNTIYYCNSLQQAWANAQSGDTVGIIRDVDLGKTVLVHNKGTRNLELNGHKLYKSKAKQSNIITVSSGATLNIYGGRLNWATNGSTVVPSESIISGNRYSNVTGLATSSFGNTTTLVHNSVGRMPVYLKANNGSWYYTEMDNQNCTYMGGMIAGGWSSGDGGAIRLEGNSSHARLFNVYLVGNIANNNGGAISMNGKYQKVELDNSTIAFNRAVNTNGGGVYMGENYGTLTMKDSHIEFNLADDNGGGVSINGKNCTVIGNSNAVDPSDKAYPSTKWQNRDRYNADTFFNPYFRNGQMYANEYLRTQENQDAHSTIAMNIVPDCDLNGGGGGVHVAGDSGKVAGLNIFRNYAGGSGMTSTWRGRGGGVELKNVKSSVANCNIWKNWSRSEGGGVYVDNDKCSVSNITVTENYAHSNGWSGGGVYVLGTVNLAISGVCRIWDNTSAESGDKPHNDNLYLGYYNTMYARLYPALAKGSKIYLWMSGAGTTITKVKGEYDERMFYSDDSEYYVKYTSEKTLSLVKGKSSNAYLTETYPPLVTTTLTPDGELSPGSRTVKSTTFKGTKGEFPVYRGVAELPAFDDTSKDYTSTFFYSDGYFFEDPKKYEPHLATLSIHLAASAFYSNDGNKGGVLYGNKTGQAGVNFPNIEGDETYYPIKSNNIRQFLSDIGVAEKDIYLNDFNIQKPKSDTIGVAIGSKVLKNADGTHSDKTLVIIGVRGAGYEQEWISNLTLGLKGEAKGFSSAAKQVFSEVRKYLKQKDIDGSSENTLFWVAGYSRAGATSNLTGKRIVDAYDTQGQRTFVYTFEAPQGGSNENASNAGADTNSNYRCIHNVINDVDIVPKVGPSLMGFFRYGVDHYVPGDAASNTLTEASTTYYSPDYQNGNTYKTWRDNNVDKPGTGTYDKQKNKMLTQLRTISGYNIIFSDYYHTATMKFLANKVWGNLGTQLIEESSTKIPGGDAGTFGTKFLNDLMAKEFRFRTNSTTGKSNNDKFYRFNYSAMTRGGMTFEEAIGKAAGVVFSLSSTQMEGLSSIGATIQDRIDTTDFYLKFLRGSRKASDVADEIWNALTKDTSEGRAMGYTYLQDYLTKDQFNTLKSAFPALCDVLLKYLKDDYSVTGCDMIGTFGYNAMRILSAHYPEVSIAWVRSYDSYYDKETTAYNVADSAKITSKGSWHVKAKSNTMTGDYPFVELYVAGETGQDPDENRGASLYFRLDNDEKWHPYCGPIDMSLYLVEPGKTATIHAFSIHDGIMTSVQDIVITREQPYKIKYLKIGESGTYEQTEAVTKIGDRYTIEAPDDIGGKVFKSWRVKYSYRDPFTGKTEYTTFHTSSGSERLQQTLFTYLPGFSLTEKTVSFEVNALGNYEFEAVYSEPEVIRAVAISLPEVKKGGELPTQSPVTLWKAGSVSESESSTGSTEWTNDGDGMYTVVVTLPSKTYDENLTAVVNRNDNNAAGQAVVVMRRGNAKVTRNGDTTYVSQQVRLIGYTPQQPVPGTHAVTFKVIDLNTGQELTTAGTTESKTAGEQVEITLPAISGETYLRMLDQSDTNGFEITKLNGLKVENGKLSFEMIDQDVNLVAGYVPVVEKVTVMLDRDLQPGQSRPNVKYVDLTIGKDESARVWRISSGFNISWRPDSVMAEGSVLDYDTTYGLALVRASNAKDELTGQLIGSNSAVGTQSLTGVQTKPMPSPNQDDGGLAIAQQSTDPGSTDSEPQSMTGQFKFATNPKPTLEVKYEKEATEGAGQQTGTITVIGPSFMQNRWGSLVSCSFERTRKAKVTDVLEPEPIEVAYTDNPQVSWLPSKVTALFEDGSSVDTTVDWGNLTSEVFTDGDEPLSKTEYGYYAWAEGTPNIAAISEANEPSTGNGGATPGTGGSGTEGDGNTSGGNGSGTEGSGPASENSFEVMGVIVVQALPQADEPWGYLRAGNVYGPAEEFVDVIDVGADDTTSVKLELWADDESTIEYHVGDESSEGWNYWQRYDVDSDGIEIGWGDGQQVNDGDTKTVTIEAIAFKSGHRSSEVVTYELTLVKVPSTVTYAVTTEAACEDGTKLFATTTGGGEYTFGTKVALSAPGSFAANGVVYKFNHWQANTTQVAFDGSSSTATHASFTMPKGAVKVTAVYTKEGGVAEPMANLATGAYTLKPDEASKQLVLSAAEGTEIYYNLTQGEEEPAQPNSSSAKYTGPITLSVDVGQTRTFKVKAIAVKKADEGSPAESTVASFTYTMTRLQPSFLTSVEGGFITNATDATSLPEDASTDDGVFTKAVFAKESTVTVVAKDVEGKVFKEWSAEGIDLTADQKRKARLSFTMPGNEVKLKATYGDKVNAIAITGFDEGKSFNGDIKARPSRVTYTTNVSNDPITVPLTWEKGETVTNADNSTTTNWTASFTASNTDPGFANAILVTGDKGWTATKTTGVSATMQKQVSYTDTSTTAYSVKVLCYDVNIGEVVDTCTYDYIQEDLTLDGGQYQAFIGAPAIEDECMYGWMAQTENGKLIGLDEESGWPEDGSGVYAIEAGNAAEGATIRFPQGKTNVVVVAKYIPVINRIDIEMDEPVAGQPLPKKTDTVFVTASETFGSLVVRQAQEGQSSTAVDVSLADMLDLTWSSASEGSSVAAYDTTYTATLRLKDDYQNMVSFIIDPDADIVVNAMQVSYDELELDEHATSFAQAQMRVEFATDKVKLRMVSAPTELTVSSSDTSTWPLPATVGIVTEQGSQQALVSWNMAGISLVESSIDDTTSTEVYSVPGQVNLPSSIDADGYDLSVELIVRDNQPVPVSAAPTPNPKPGEYYAKQQIKLTAAEAGVDIFYTLGTGDPVDDQQYSDAEGIPLTGEIDESVVHTIRAVAVEWGKRPSEVAEFTYTIKLSAVDKSGLADAIATAKKAGNGVKTSSDGADVPISEQYTTAAERKLLDDAIATAQKVADNPDASQEDVDGALAAVKAATDAFNKAKRAGKKSDEGKEPSKEPNKEPSKEPSKQPSKQPKYGPGKDPNQMGKDGTALGKGASAVAADNAIRSMKNDKDPAGSKISPLKLRSTKQAKGSITVKWNRASGAKTYVLYGNKCGKSYKMTKLATTTKTNFNMKKIGGKKLKKSTYHKLILVALDKNNNVVTVSKVIHVSTKGSKKRANPVKVTVTNTVVKKAKKLKKSKKLKLGAKIVSPIGAKVAKHIALRYESSNPAVATVSGKGVVKAKSKGKAKITVYAQNGVSKTVTVVVK